jgi:arginine/serine-rich splicing factor 4/5/6
MPNSENREHKSLGLTMEGEDQKPPKAEEAATEEAPTPAAAPAVSKANSEDLVGSAAIRPVFLGNLRGMFEAEQVTDIFTKPIVPPGTEEGKFSPFSVDRIDVKRGYCFIFLNDAASQADKEEAEAFVSAINGM